MCLSNCCNHSSHCTECMANPRAETRQVLGESTTNMNTTPTTSCHAKHLHNQSILIVGCLANDSHGELLSSPFNCPAMSMYTLAHGLSGADMTMGTPASDCCRTWPSSGICSNSSSSKLTSSQLLIRQWRQKGGTQHEWCQQDLNNTIVVMQDS